jgi:methyl-accepting chemotaxis protein
VIAISKNMALLTAISVVWVATLALLWLYMTYYLVTPINTVKKSIEEVTAGNLSITIPEFGNNCAGRLIPGINSLSASIATLVNDSYLFTKCNGSLRSTGIAKRRAVG